MKHFDYVWDDTKEAYRIFDRVRGRNNTIALVYDPTDAQRIVDALNATEKV